VEADLVTAPVDPPHELADPGVVDEVERATARVDVIVRQEVEGAAHAVAFAHGHQEVEGVVRIPVQPPAAGVSERARPSDQETRVSPPHHISRELAGEQRPGAPERRQRVVDVVREQHAVVVAGGGQVRPQVAQRRAEHLDVGVDEGEAQEVGAHGEGRRRGEAPVAVAIPRNRLLVPGEHREGAAEDVDVHAHA
jgi:hypothetical protein